MTHPYDGQGPESYWRTGVAEAGMFGLQDLWTPKFRIRPHHRIATAGSCFAQHIGKALSARGYGWTDYEPAPPYLLGAAARDYNYGVFSTRTGNVYTPAMLLQWLHMAFEDTPPPEEVWAENGRFLDPMRPRIEPEGFETVDDLQAARAATCAALRRAVTDSQLFVFTLGLTESWINKDSGLEYALCPGTAGGTFDASQRVFRNANMRHSYRAMAAAIRVMMAHNARLKVLLTVSPVPLTATASGKHVLTATTYSKSVLRAVAGMLTEERPNVDYFPSYEIITAPAARGMFYAPNMRSVVPDGVNTVMGHFFAGQDRVFGPPKARKGQGAASDPAPTEDVRCDEEILDAFAA